MPWKAIGIVDQQKQFVEQWLSQEWTMTELCERHGISRPAGYNRVARYRQAGWEAHAAPFEAGIQRCHSCSSSGIQFSRTPLRSLRKTVALLESSCS
jgi:hypothetical protein